MIDYKEFTSEKDINMGIQRTKNGSYSDTIYTFDIETSSMFYINGAWRSFDRSIDDYKNIPKACCPYIGMFGVEGTVYYFRDMKDGFLHMLKMISNPLLTKTVWVHNLGYEFAFYQWILANYTIVDMVARKARTPISFKIKELNIIMRCSLRLTELKLEICAEQYTDLEKKVGDLDYELLRSPLTKLNEKEMGYCEYDILCLWKVVDHFRKTYHHIKSIPLTQTGTMRKAYRKIVPGYHNAYCKKQIPTVSMYKILNKCFWGGITHPNILHAKKYLKDLTPYDIASSYPYAMCAFKYPAETFKEISVDHMKRYPKEEYCFIYDVILTNVKSKLYNHYIPFSKCIEYSNISIDNGRIVTADMLHMQLTCVDYDIITQAYECDVEILHLYKAKKKYLPKYFIKFILDMYRSKTTLKGVEEKKDLYMKDKQILNSSFGACCTNIVASSIAFDHGEWITGEFNDDVIRENLYKLTQSHSNLFVYAHGVFITAYSRKRLFQPFLDHPDLDSDIVYYDTDSHKILNGEVHKDIYLHENEIADEKLKEMCKAYDIDFELTRPKDMYGNEHPLGWWENESESHGICTEFCTLGAKRYCYRDREGLHLVVSGVGKNGVTALNNNIRNFNGDTFFDYDHSGKLCHTYVENQKDITFTDIDGNEYTSHWRSGVILEPTTYQMGLSSYYEALIDAYARLQDQKQDFIERNEKLTTHRK